MELQEAVLIAMKWYKSEGVDAYIDYDDESIIIKTMGSNDEVHCEVSDNEVYYRMKLWNENKEEYNERT